MKRKSNFLIAIVFLAFNGFSQTKELTYNEFLGYVKKYHPLVKQANLNISEAQAQLMQARGAFDPKIDVDFDKKNFKDKNYYSLFNGSFKIPTWYGIELKAAFDNNEGIYVNPENTTPNNGLTSVGISIPVGQGLFINQRMADIRKAKLAQTLNTAERDLQALEIIHEASLRYFDWKKNYAEVKLYENYLKNAQTRFDGVTKLIEQGDKPAIDSIEAGITVKNRKLNLEDSNLKLTKARLALSNYIWTIDNIPLEIDESIIPETNLTNTIQETLNQNSIEQFQVENHPKIKAWNTKINMLEIDRKLKANFLLPKLDLSYNYLSEPSYFSDYRFQDYKISLNFSMPLFLRKERASLKLAKLKIQDSEFSRQFESLQLQNKIKAQEQEIISLKKQFEYTTSLVNDFDKMLKAEDRLFEIGESSLFVINTRENSLVSAQINNIAIENRLYNAFIGLYQSLGNLSL
ncbi:TolC family protein [Flavobacterium terrae]|uniref:Outer membrane protein TolC n=1 Tax=Flavobacterium terrae TaxID=415425 RepID=A0A1M6DT79_9FLAO|nr:TolC family protein [Flavobacterium terrae]SHI76385.1 Outer membrane protein TolC [Flavobacterium terrae]